jgi:hypothetical protein
MDLRVMVAVSAAITGERLRPAGEPVARAIGTLDDEGLADTAAANPFYEWVPVKLPDFETMPVLGQAAVGHLGEAEDALYQPRSDARRERARGTSSDSSRR